MNTTYFDEKKLGYVWFSSCVIQSERGTKKLPPTWSQPIFVSKCMVFEGPKAYNSMIGQTLEDIFIFRKSYKSIVFPATFGESDLIGHHTNNTM